jgi:ribosomal protein S15P/S13E
MMVGRRNRLLRYLARTNAPTYQATIKRLGLRK